jgi:hypothetical protein
MAFTEMRESDTGEENNRMMPVSEFISIPVAKTNEKSKYKFSNPFLVNTSENFWL